MMKTTLRVLLVVLLSSWATLAMAQQKQVTGNVKDAKGTPVVGASVLEKGTTNGSSTDENGNFSITVSGAKSILLISSVGMASQEVTVGSNNSLTIALKSSEGTMDAVVVTALGISKQKKALGYSVTEVKGSELAKTNEVNPINALQGKVAGVQIDQGAGGLFGNTKIVIRGNSTLGKNNQPIFVIDGVIMDNDIFEGTGRDFA